MNAATADSLYKTVRALGLTRGQVRRLLPSWWSPEVEKSPDGVAELAMHLGRRLSLDVAQLLSGRVAPKGAVRQIAYKHQARVDTPSLEAASYIASSLAQTIIASTPTPYTPLPRRADALATEAREIGRGLINFSSLVAMSWRHGIPVVPLPHLPVGVRKMDGAALRVGDRPAIVVSKRKSSRAWLSFIVAHEIAHIVLGHVAAGSTIVDVSLQDMATYASESGQDNQEAEADRLALEMLGGGIAEIIISKWSRTWSPVELAVAAKAAASDHGLEAGHLILRHAFVSRRWPEAITALRFLSEDMDAEGELIRQLKINVQLESIADDLRDMVIQITGWDDAD